MMRENTDSEAFYQKYTLSEETMARLESIREALKDNIAQANPMWKLIAEEVRIVPVQPHIVKYNLNEVYIVII